jgi:hypothetical protein
MTKTIMNQKLTNLSAVLKIINVQEFESLEGSELFTEATNRKLKDFYKKLTV